MHRDDPSVAKGAELPDFLVEPDAGRLGGQVDMTENQDRLAEVGDLLNPNRETFPCPAAIVVPGLSRTVMAPVDGFPTLQGWLNGGMPLHLGIKLGEKASRSSVFHASAARRTVSTFSCDIAR